MTPVSTPSTPPPPDISRDRLVLIDGGVVVMVHDVMVEISDSAPCWITLVPTQWNDFEKERLEKGEPFYPRERHIRILHDMRVGTVQELVNDYKEKLTRVWEALACKQADGTYGVIPAFGEASFRKQEQVLDDHLIRMVGSSPSLQGSFKASRRELLARQQQRNLVDQYEPSQSPLERDVLMRLVAEYLDRRWPEHTYDLFGPGPHPPTDSPRAVQVLIDALTQLKQDAEGRERAQWELAALQGKKLDIPQGGGTGDVTGEKTTQAAQQAQSSATAGGP